MLMTSPETIISPLTGHRDARLVSTISAAYIIEEYLKQFNLDVSNYFEGIPQIGIYECPGTGFRFFHPASIAGKASLYQHLGQYPWFYQEGKWEHTVALTYLHAGQKILDVGCGTGRFLLSAKREKGAEATGIELNADSVQTARAQGLDVVNELIDDHVRTRPQYYDVVCLFEVLEHVPSAGPFITNCLQALKPGGLFIVAVPNNDAFIKYASDAVLNGPPHHMGLWTRTSLTALQRLFPIEALCIAVEPLNTIEWYQSVMERRYLPERWIRSLYYWLGGAKRFNQYLADNAASIAGHTIIAVYRKLDEFPV